MINLKILNNINGEYININIHSNVLNIYEFATILDNKIQNTCTIFYILLNGEKIYTNIYKIKPFNKLITFIVDSNNNCELNVIYTSFIHNNEDYYYKLLHLNRPRPNYNDIENILDILVVDNSDLLDDENFIVYATNIVNTSEINIFKYAS